LVVEASENLHSIKAKYPKKIAFYNVPYLAIESLEVDVVYLLLYKY